MKLIKRKKLNKYFIKNPPVANVNKIVDYLDTKFEKYFEKVNNSFKKNARKDS